MRHSRRSRRIIISWKKSSLRSIPIKLIDSPKRPLKERHF